jgi:stage III sporulation protein AH
MINKKGVWFLTLFSLILVLSVYYITMPPELLIANNKLKDKDTSPVAKVEESSILVALRVEADEDMEVEIDSLKKIISNAESSVEEKNKAFEKIKELNSNRSIEENLETVIETKHSLKSFIQIEGNNIEVIVNATKHDDKLANDIMRTIQESFDTSKNITIKFQK